MTKGEPNKLGNYIFKQPNYKAPLKGLEPLHLAPEASALSSELQGPIVQKQLKMIPQDDTLFNARSY